MPYYDSISTGYNELYEEEQMNKILLIKENIKIDQNTKIRWLCNLDNSISEMKRVGSKDFVFAININKIVEEDKDAIFFCEKP